uniref:Uncharacterized protein n=1 Tax=Rhizophora mucronata TaxID=61149 RepID=A0A2P2P0Z6_RHIMU
MLEYEEWYGLVKDTCLAAEVTDKSKKN